MFIRQSLCANKTTPLCARLRHVAGTPWGNKKYMNMKHLEAAIEDVSMAGFIHTRGCKPICAKLLTLPNQSFDHNSSYIV